MPAGLVGNDIAIGGGGLGLVAWAGQSGHSVATAAMFLRTSKLCCPGAKPRSWAPPLATYLVEILSTK